MVPVLMSSGQVYLINCPLRSAEVAAAVRQTFKQTDRTHTVTVLLTDSLLPDRQIINYTTVDRCTSYK